MARKVTTVLSLRDNYTAVIKKAKRYTSAFDKDVQKMAARLDRESKKKHDIRVKNSAAMKALTVVEKKIAPMRDVMVKVAANVQHFKNQIKPVTDTVKKISTKAWTVTVKLKDAASAGLRKLTSALKKAGTVVAVGGAALVGAGAYAVNQGMQLQGYDVAMRHYIQASNPNLNSTQVKDQTDAYLGWLRKNANETPFGTNEVIQAGSRAVGVTSGNTAAAQGLVKMAEDMAALTPGKTVMDAMEALADATMGEMERLKEFNFKGTQEALKAAGGDLFKMKDATGRTLAGWFGGGAEEFSKTTAGMLSTLTGEIESQIAEAGVGMAEQLKPFLQWVISDVLPDLKAFLTVAGENGKTGIQMLGDSLQTAYYWLKDEVPNAIDTLISSFEKMKAALLDPSNVFNQILKIFGVDLNATGAALGPDKKGGAARPLGTPIFPLKLPEVAGHQVTAGDALTGFVALKGTSILSKLFTGKGLLAHGGNAIKTGAQAGAAAVNSGAVALAGASPTAGAVMTNGVNMLGSALYKYGLGTMAPMVVDWMDRQARLAEFDYYEKTGKWDFANAPWGDKAAVWMNRGLPGLNGWTPPGMVDSLNNAHNAQKYFTPEAAMNGFKLMTEQPEVASKNLKTALGILFGGVAAAEQPVSEATTAFDGVSDASNSAALNMANLKLQLERMSTVHLNNSGEVTGGGSGKPFAAGIKRVPFDNYPALLHKGETVLPSGEAGAYRSNGNRGAGNNISLNITVNGGGMDENRLASILVNRLQEVALNMA